MQEEEIEEKRRKRRWLILLVSAGIVFGGGGIAAGYYSLTATGTGSTQVTIDGPSTQYQAVTVAVICTGPLEPNVTVQCYAHILNASEYTVQVTKSSEIISLNDTDTSNCPTTWFTLSTHQPNWLIPIAPSGTENSTPFTVEMKTEPQTQLACVGMKLTVALTLAI